jgi:hypothetical protein
MNASFNAPRSQSLARLEQLTVDIEASLKHRGDVRYVLRVHHKSSRARWSFSRSFDEYKIFKNRLLEVMQQGHSCSAECPWLYSFLTSYFPKSSMFRSSSASVVEHRRESLTKILTQLHAFLLSRSNQMCHVTQAVADELAKFVGAEMIDQIPSDKLNQQRASSDSLLSVSSTDDESTEDAHCPLCEEKFGNGEDCCYTTVLRCGHEFHDECIISKLNESMTCPVCGHAEA